MLQVAATGILEQEEEEGGGEEEEAQKKKKTKFSLHAFFAKSK
jgi:hypothetical protein